MRDVKAQSTTAEDDLNPPNTEITGSAWSLLLPLWLAPGAMMTDRRICLCQPTSGAVHWWWRGCSCAAFYITVREGVGLRRWLFGTKKEPRLVLFEQLRVVPVKSMRAVR